MPIKALVLSAYTVGLGEIAAAGETGLLLGYGPLGLITAWLMYRDERRAIQARESEARNAEYHHDILHRIDGMTKALLAVDLEKNTFSPQFQEYARQTIAKIDARSKEK